ncbi:predicted protein [Sclerotinia sclerotiorum 1980 UF-70]|uniref:Uncharacterized protein n=1 Tax=Sclerotinia sclerotiorum (strain ATCC 18683 / 1980 / Ss-1) TaxID=665079 RepID=A7EYR7_SCLS1|nr:predicted protein [Sclerotinia sclerotiorum 1980 UF-70]EDN94609.1 predicted protein [Sclerotinia sclerotiorum 1980 UF-70]
MHISISTLLPPIASTFSFSCTAFQVQVIITTAGSMQIMCYEELELRKVVKVDHDLCVRILT